MVDDLDDLVPGELRSRLLEAYDKGRLLPAAAQTELLRAGVPVSDRLLVSTWLRTADRNGVPDA